MHNWLIARRSATARRLGAQRKKAGPLRWEAWCTITAMIKSYELYVYAFFRTKLPPAAVAACGCMQVRDCIDRANQYMYVYAL